MTVYVVTCVVEEEYGMSENVAVYATKRDAEKYLKNRQEKWRHWNGKEYDRYSIEEWEVK